MLSMPQKLEIDFHEELHCNDEYWDELEKEILESIDLEGNLIDEREQKKKG